MSPIINLDPICDTFEAKHDKRKMERIKNVIDEYSRLCNVDFRKENEFTNDYNVFDFLLQITVAKPELFDEFHRILTKYGFNDKTYLDYLIKKITKGASNAEAFIDGLINVGLVSDVYDKDDNSIDIKTILGTYNFFLANEYFADNEEIVSYIENGDTNRNCHVNTLFLLKTLKQGEALTAKCSTMFNNLYYHSYYRYNGMICDININCVMSEQDYNKIYNPEIISIVNIDNFKEKQDFVKKNSTSTLIDLLEIAVYEEAKIIKEDSNGNTF